MSGVFESFLSGKAADASQFVFYAQQLVEFFYAFSRQALPVLMWPALTATAKSAMKLSEVSPLRCDTNEL